MSVKKCPQVAVRKDRNESIDFVYVEIDDDIMYDREKSVIGDSIMINKGPNGKVIGLDIMCPINDVMRDEVRKLLVCANVGAGNIYTMMMELP